jgi:hypothetical protein
VNSPSRIWIRTIDLATLPELYRTYQRNTFGGDVIRRISTLVFFLALFISGPAFSQNASTSLRGTVKDPVGAAVPGATVTITNSAIGSKASVQSNAQGEYSFNELTPGTYIISIQAPGFGVQTRKAELLVSQPATINVQVAVAADNTTVDVSAAAATINTTDATLGNAVNNETIMNLPSEGRNPQTLLALEPGVLYIGSTGSADSRNGSVSGARADQTNITLDGVDNNDQIAPSAFTGVLITTLDSTEEFRVTTASANADTGRSSGGQVNLVTRSGTNQLHGALYEYNRNNWGQANDWFTKQSQLQSDAPNIPGKLIRNVYGARLGGPILKDKIFLFGNYEGQRLLEGTSVARTVPTPSLRAGLLTYPDANGGVTTLTPLQIAQMDTRCTGNGTCPQGPGVNPASLAVFQQYPLPNGFNLGDGYNTASYTFSGNTQQKQGVYVSRADFIPNEKNRLYVRGSIQNVVSSNPPFFPGQAANSVTSDDSRGISGNYTWLPKSNLVNNLRYGYIRQSFATTGAGSGVFTTFRTLDTPVSQARSSSTVVPEHNIIDDLTWTKGRHQIQFGANYRRFTYENKTDNNSYSTAIANPFWMLNSGFANKTAANKPPVTFDAGAFGFAPVDPNFDANYDFAISALAGLTNEETDHFNYQIAGDGSTASLLAQGAPVTRSFRSNEFEYYVQDSFKVMPNLTITAGLRHTIQQTPYETNGQQVQATINLHQWFQTRGQQAALGNSVQPEISFAPSGQSRGGKPFYPMNWGNVAPRLAIAYAPDAKTSIRGGFGVYFDHYGQGLITNYSRSGSFSLSSSISNPASSQTADTTPRFTGLHTLPGLVPSATAKITYPQTPSDDPNGTGFAITYGLDDHLKTPYSEVFNLSFQRELPGGFTIETAYVGRLGRHLLQQIDLAQPLDLVDPKSGMDYYTAGTQLSQAVDAGLTNVPAIAYFENLFPDAKGLDTAGDGAVGNTATQNIYNDLWTSVRGNETAALNQLDENCYPGCGGKVGRYWPLQYSSLYVTSSLGTSSYNAGQVVLRHPMKHGVQLDVSYTFSKSLDLGSDTEGNPTSSGNAFGFILDAFNPRKNYAVSDFNTTHLLTADWVLKLPVGRGEMIGRNSNHFVNAAIGGWYLAGILRTSSGLPFGIYDGDGWATNWEWESAQVQTGPIKMRKHLDSNGSPQAFDTPPVTGVNMRDPYPGEAGQRNHFKGDGYFDVDSGLHKDVQLSDRYKFAFAWEVFNVTNSERFDVHQIDGGSTDGSQLGVYSGGLLASRRMQFSGRFEF